MVDGCGTMPTNFVNKTSFARNLEKSQLGGVIFGCKNNTMNECLSKQIFGLPASHFSYVKNIDPGLPLFLFNYNDKKLHGIFDSASSGQMNIDPYGWTTDGSRRTHYPAQVQICVRLQCYPLPEEKFKPIILDNYYNRCHFWFELDHAQTSKLMLLFASSPIPPGTSIPINTTKPRTIYQLITLPERGDEGCKRVASEVEICSDCIINSLDDTSLDCKNQPLENQVNMNESDQVQNDPKSCQLQELALNDGSRDLSLMDCAKGSTSMNERSRDLSLMDCAKGSTSMNETFMEGRGFAEEQVGSREKNEDISCASLACQSIIAQLVQGMEELKAFKAEQNAKMYHLEQKLVEAEGQIKQLKDRCMMLESRNNLSFTNDNNRTSDPLDEVQVDLTKSIYLVGGYDGESWLSTLDLYHPSLNVLKSLRPMSVSRSYASIAQLSDEIYVFGGGNGNLWSDTVESYNPANDQWTLRPSLTGKRGSLGGATLNDKIFAVGGGNGLDCFADVEMLDFDVGRWIPTRSMLQKRFALAAVELNGILYATGGFDGNDYLSSAERFDPREHCWTRIASMNTKRGCHSLVVLNEKLYALGGFDGSTMVSSVEIYDPRVNSWVNGDPMNNFRGYSAAAVVEESIYVIGGLKSGEVIEDTVERFKVGQGWQKLSTSKKRCFLSAIVLQ